MAILVRSTLGLDLGSHSVKAFELRQTLRGVEVGAVNAMPSEDPDDPRSFGERLASFLEMHRLPADNAICALPGDRLTGRHLSFPFSDRRRLAQAVPLAVEDELPFDLEGMLVDWERVGGDRRQTEVVAIIAPVDLVAERMAQLEEAGVTPRILEAEGLALANLAGLYGLDGVRVLADLGHRKTTLCLCVDGSPLATRTLRIGAGQLSEALRTERGVDAAAAEALKAEAGVAGLLGGAAGAALDRLARETARSLGAFEPLLADRGGRRLDEITLMGGGANLHGIDGYLADRLGVPVQRLTPPDSEEGRALLAAGDPALFGPAAALAARGSARARTRTDFRQGEFAMRFDVGALGRQLVATGVLAGIALLLTATLAFTGIATRSQRADAVEGQMAQLWSEAFPDQPVPSNVLGGMQNAVRSAHDRAEFLGVYRGNLSALDLLTEISARVPKDLDVVFEELSIDRQVVRIRGHSKSFEAVDRLRAELQKFEPFSEIKVSEITSGREGAKSFNVTISLEPRGGPA